jgi:hypothetical protein
MKNKLLSILALLLVAVTGVQAQSYNITVAEGTEDADKWSVAPNLAAEDAAVTATYSGTKKVKSVKAVKKAAAEGIVNPVVGQIIGSDGKNYEVGSTLPTGVTAEAVIAYVGNDTDDDTYKNGLAIALDYDYENELIWTAAKLVCENKTAITGAKWCLPSRKQWEQMLVANGDNVASSQGLRTIITNAGGEGWEIITYWTSTECENWQAYVMADIGYSTFVATKIAADIFVRACLVF